MTGISRYGGIDSFRVVCAFMVAAIHTSPLTSIGMTEDFVLTRIFCRVAVPFFFMATGYFLLGGDSDRSYTPFAKKTLMIYGISILLYLPINYYAGYFSEDNLGWNMIKDVVFNGTFYHLWYFPAVLIGAGIVLLLLKKCGEGVAIALCSLLYVIGLTGDSYYGIGEQIPALNGLLNGMFHLFDYTRNGLFFAPLFILMGALFKKERATIKAERRTWSGLLLVSLVLMTAEALILHFCNLQRHDSMYIMLVPVMYTLFGLLLSIEALSSKRMRDFAMVFYIIHPMMIILVRGGAKVISMEDMFITNSVGHYIAVCVCSVAFSLVMMAVLDFARNRRKGRVKSA